MDEIEIFKLQPQRTTHLQGFDDYASAPHMSTCLPGIAFTLPGFPRS
jgi:hypothetical protein